MKLKIEAIIDIPEMDNSVEAMKFLIEVIQSQDMQVKTFIYEKYETNYLKGNVIGGKFIARIKEDEFEDLLDKEARDWCTANCRHFLNIEECKFFGNRTVLDDGCPL